MTEKLFTGTLNHNKKKKKKKILLLMIDIETDEPLRGKICLRGFRLNMTQTDKFGNRDRLENDR